MARGVPDNLSLLLKIAEKYKNQFDFQYLPVYTIPVFGNKQKKSDRINRKNRRLC